MKILIGCEVSQIITKAFRTKGHEAFSCDIKPCTGGQPDWHIQDDLLLQLDAENWDMAIIHPPCTYLSVSGAQWFYHPDDKHLPTADRRPHPKYPNRDKDRHEAILFFFSCVDAPIPKICIENLIGIMSTHYKEADQIIQPYYFGDEAQKTTCLWLKGLPKLIHHKEKDLFNESITHVGKGEFITTAGGNKLPKWYSDAKTSNKELTQTIRSQTFPGIARAMANQWG